MQFQSVSCIHLGLNPVCKLLSRADYLSRLTVYKMGGNYRLIHTAVGNVHDVLGIPCPRLFYYQVVFSEWTPSFSVPNPLL